jgi:HEAT repeat protein
MNHLAAIFERHALLVVAVAWAFAAAMIVAVVIERITVAAHEAWLRCLTTHYTPLLRLALAGDPGARATLRRSHRWHRLTIARMILMPLIKDRDPARIAEARALVDALSLVPFAERLLGSPWWWRRAMALRALGAMQSANHTRAIVAALDDSNEDVRNTALDALADLQDPASLPAIVVRLHDTSLHRARRGAVLAAFGAKCEPFLLDLAVVDPEHRLNYALALGICGTAEARSILCEWSRDIRAEVRAAAMQALSRVGVDPWSVPFAVAALEDRHAIVRAMAATALQGYADRDTAASLARHLDDKWAVAVRAARSLRSMEAAGRAELEARATRDDLPALLARQMLWNEKAAR